MAILFYALTGMLGSLPGMDGLERQHVSDSSPHAGVNCTSNEECSLLGVCIDRKCECDHGWSGVDCGVLNLLPVVHGSGYNLTGQTPPISSWGANIFPAPKGSLTKGDTGMADPDVDIWHMLAAEFEGHCDISHWSPNSAIIHAVSTTGADGPYTRQGWVCPVCFRFCVRVRVRCGCAGAGACGCGCAWSTGLCRRVRVAIRIY